MAEKVITIADSITVGELAEKLNLPVTNLIGELFKNGIVSTINQRIDFETASIIVEELGIDVELQKKEATTLSQRKVHQLSQSAVTRPPIVAVMGHVDHGKTSLLDSILQTKVVDGEAGGITQHISAYQTVRKGRSITFLDTPGHEAFAALRQHGATLTDIVIIVVAADDGVKPQTVEAIRFAKLANSKIVVAINKMDKEAANPGLVKGQLAEQGIISDDPVWGGDVAMVEVSAKTGLNVDKLLDMVLLVADLEDLRADIDTPAEGLVIESHMEVGRGPVVGLLVEQGMLRPGHFLIAGTTYGKVRTLLDFAGKTLKQAGPSTPVIVTGFKELPQFGDNFGIVKSEKEARNHVAVAKIEQEKNAASTNITGADLLKMMSQQTESQDLNVIVKADVQGSLTSVVNSLKIIDTQGEIALRIIGSGVGNITENDIRLAADKKTIVYGFNVDISPAVKQLAARDNVQVRLFKVIYRLLDDARLSMEALLAPDVVETEIGAMTIKGISRTSNDEV
ncbi:translation initiation factor IF-2, partial [Candidatus Saccharibacteria bacterium CG_4_9_14_0_2_um_filter_41_9]